MDKRFTTHWELIDEFKEDLLARVAARPVEEQGKPPMPGEWSPLEVIAHLITSEQFMVGYATPDSAKHTKTSGLSQRIVVGMLCAVLRSGVRLPTPEVMLPPKEVKTLETLSKEWEATRRELREALARITPDAVFGVHPYFGPVTARQVLEMAETHLIYHTKRFPGAGNSSL